MTKTEKMIIVVLVVLVSAVTYLFMNGKKEDVKNVTENVLVDSIKVDSIVTVVPIVKDTVKTDSIVK